MSLSRRTRILMIITLLPALLTMVYIVWNFSWQTLGMYADLGGFYSPYLIIFLGSITTLVFVAMAITTMAGTKPVSRWTFILGIILGIIGCAGMAFFLFGVFQDMTGTHCTGLFGAETSCTLGPLLVLHILIINPIALGITGLLALTAIIMQLRIASSGKSTENM